MNAPLLYDPSQAGRDYKIPWPTADSLWEWRDAAYDNHDIWARYVLNLIEKTIDMSHEFSSRINGHPVSVAVPTIIIAALWQHDADRGFHWIDQKAWGDRIIPNAGQRLDQSMCRRLAACAADLIGSWAADEGMDVGTVTKKLRDDPMFAPVCVVACTEENPAWETVDLVQQLAAEQLSFGPGMELRAAAARHEPGDDAKLPRFQITLTNADRQRLVVRPGRAEFRLVDIARLGQFLASVPTVIIT